MTPPAEVWSGTSLVVVPRAAGAGEQLTRHDAASCERGCRRTRSVLHHQQQVRRRQKELRDCETCFPSVRGRNRSRTAPRAVHSAALIACAHLSEENDVWMSKEPVADNLSPDSARYSLSPLDVLDCNELSRGLVSLEPDDPKVPCSYLLNLRSVRTTEVSAVGEPHEAAHEATQCCVERESTSSRGPGCSSSIKVKHDFFCLAHQLILRMARDTHFMTVPLRSSRPITLPNARPVVERQHFSAKYFFTPESVFSRLPTPRAHRTACGQHARRRRGCRPHPRQNPRGENTTAV